MPTIEIIFYGMAGAFGALLIGQVLPWAVAFKNGNEDADITSRKLIFGAVVLAVALFLGGLLACAGQPSKPMEALAFGITWQTFFGGFTGALEAAGTRP